MRIGVGGLAKAGRFDYGGSSFAALGRRILKEADEAINILSQAAGRFSQLAIFLLVGRV